MQGIERKNRMNSWGQNECLQQEVLLKSQVNATDPKYLSAKKRWKSNWTGLYLAEHGFDLGKSDLPRQEGIECDITLCILSLRSWNASVSWKKNGVMKRVMSAINSCILLNFCYLWETLILAEWLWGEGGLRLDTLPLIHRQSYFLPGLNSWFSRKMSSSGCLVNVVHSN